MSSLHIAHKADSIVHLFCLSVVVSCVQRERRAALSIIFGQQKTNTKALMVAAQNEIK